jgi:hypothetical protein
MAVTLFGLILKTGYTFEIRAPTFEGIASFSKWQKRFF